MNKRLNRKMLVIFLFIFSLPILSQSQEKKYALKDSSKTWLGDFFIGAEIGNTIVALLDDHRDSYWDAFAKVRVYKRWNLTASFGSEKHTYNKNDWNIDVEGNFLKFGIEFGFPQTKNINNQYLIGLRYAISSFDQTINQFVIRTHNGADNIFGSLPKASVQTRWLEIVVGAQLELFKTGFFASVAFTPRIKLSETTQNNSENLYTPGFGEDINSRSFGFNWSIFYRIPI